MGTGEVVAGVLVLLDGELVEAHAGTPKRVAKERGGEGQAVHVELGALRSDDPVGGARQEVGGVAELVDQHLDPLAAGPQALELAPHGHGGRETDGQP